MAQEKKIVKIVKSWINLNPSIDPNELIQSVDGHIVRVRAGWVLAVQHGSGFIDVHRSGLAFVPPLATGDFLADHDLSRSFEYKDNKKTLDDVTVEAHENISYEYRPLPDDSSFVKVLSEPSTDEVIRKYVQDIVTLIVTNSNSIDIKHGFDVNSSTIPNWLSPNAKQRLINIFNEIKRRGCDIVKIHICDFNEPKAIIDAETAREAQRIQLDAEEEKARRERGIRIIQAQTDNLIKTYHYRILDWVIRTQGFNEDQAFQFIKADLLKESNVVHIMGNGNVDPIAASILSNYKQQIRLNDASQSNTNEPIDASFEDDNPGFSRN